MMEERTRDQRVRLDQMDEQEAGHFITGLLARLDPEEEYDARHQEDFEMEMPQSGERFRGRDNLRAMQEAYPTGPEGPPTVQARRVLVREGLWVVEGAIDYGEGRAFDVVMICELRDGRMWRDRWYFADPFEAPGWRARWVERMEPDAAPAPGGSKAGRQNEMNEHEVRGLIDRQLEKMMSSDFAGAHEWYDDAVVVEWPQSGERIRGKENLLALRESYPTGVEFEVRRVTARRDLGVGEYVIRYDGTPVHVVAIVEFGGGKVVRETHYFADPFPAPAWRSRWVEKMEA